MSSKVYRQGLDRDEAKALSVMQQKWPKLSRQEMSVDLHKIIQRVGSFPLHAFGLIHPTDSGWLLASCFLPASG